MKNKLEELTRELKKEYIEHQCELMEGYDDRYQVYENDGELVADWWLSKILQAYELGREESQNITIDEVETQSTGYTCLKCFKRVNKCKCPKMGGGIYTTEVVFKESNIEEPMLTISDKGILTINLSSFLEQQIEKAKLQGREEVVEMAKGMKKDTTPYSENLTECCNEPEQEGEDGLLYCPECRKRFPELVNTNYNQALKDIIKKLKDE